MKTTISRNTFTAAVFVAIALLVYFFMFNTRTIYDNDTVRAMETMQHYVSDMENYSRANGNYESASQYGCAIPVPVINNVVMTCRTNGPESFTLTADTSSYQVVLNIGEAALN